MATQQSRPNPPPPQKGVTVTDTKPLPKRNIDVPVNVETLRDLFVKMGPELSAALPRTGALDAKRLVRLALTTVQRSRDLQACTARSLLGAIMQAGALGLEIDSALGHAYLVPFGREATLLVGYRGFITLAMRTGNVSAIYASAVYERDKWSVEKGTNPVIHHVPARPLPAGAVSADGTIANEIVAFYAVVQMKDHAIKSEWMWKADVDAIRQRSRAGQSGPWVTDYEAMGAKTVIRRLCKTLGLSAELTRAAAADEALEFGVDDMPLVDYELPPALAKAATASRKEELRDEYLGKDKPDPTKAAGVGESDGDPSNDPPPEPERDPGAEG